MVVERETSYYPLDFRVGETRDPLRKRLAGKRVIDATVIQTGDGVNIYGFWQRCWVFWERVGKVVGSSWSGGGVGEGIAGVSGGRIVGVVGSGGMAKKRGKWSCRLARNRDAHGQFKRGGKMG
nr:hypothetical protein [Tanacetum cinerariifolium]